MWRITNGLPSVFLKSAVLVAFVLLLALKLLSIADGHSGADIWYIPYISDQSYFRGLREIEPNSPAIQANGGLYSNLPYTGYPNDQYDYFYFYLLERGPVYLRLENHAGERVQLVLYRPVRIVDGQIQLQLLGRAAKPPFEFVVPPLEPGTYYVLVYSESRSTVDQEYTLFLEYPGSAPTPTATAVPTATPAHSPTPSPTVAPTFTPTPMATPTPQARTLEDFEGTAEMTWWTPDEEVYVNEISTEQKRAGLRSLKVQYGKSGPFQFLAADPGDALCDISWAENLDVWYYGEPVPLLLKLWGANDVQEELPLQTARQGATWTLFRYDLRAVSADLDQTCIKNFLFFPAPGDAAAGGTFFLDEIQLRSSGGTLEDFERFRYMDWWSPDPEVFRYEEASPGRGGQRSLKIAYDKSSGDQAIAAEIPLGLRDLRDSQTLNLWIKGDIEKLAVRLEDEAGLVGNLGEQSLGNPSNWRRVCLPVRQVRSVIDLGAVKNIFFAVDPGDPNAGGTMYIDDIYLSDQACP